MFNISEIKSLSGGSVLDEGLPHEFPHPITGEKTGAVWTIRSYESEAYKAVSRRVRDAGVKSLQRKKLSAAQLDENEIELITALVSGWSGMTDGEDNHELPFSSEAVAKILSIPIVGAATRQWVDSKADDNEAFFKASSKRSGTLSTTTSVTKPPKPE